MTLPLWFWTVWAFTLAGLALLTVTPQVATLGIAHRAAPAAVHLLTLGAVLSGYYGLQSAGWLQSYGRGRWFAPLQWSLWGLHAAGAASLAWGLYRQNGPLAYLGGHYLVPTAIALFAIHGIALHIRHRRTAPTGPIQHLPVMGLLVAMALGVMLVMDRFFTDYGTYSPPVILLHALAAGFLFVLPAQQLAGWGGRTARGGAETDSAVTSPRPPVLARTLLAALGLFAMALAGQGFAHGVPLGLAILAAVALWSGLPGGAERAEGAGDTGGRFAMLRRLPWALVGVLLGYAALRTARGLEPGEALNLAKLTVTIFLLGLVLPDWLYRLAPQGRVHEPASHSIEALFAPEWIYAAQAAGTVLIAAGQLAAGQLTTGELSVRLGAAVWLLSLGAMAARILVVRRFQLRFIGARR
ncbi:MAG: hypothetical protein O7A67_11360 [SAR324 cluster bacterium]|nr:hypothetical protein [SAR324 cluster bacterium]